MSPAPRHPFRSLRPPAAPPELRLRALGAARSVRPRLRESARPYRPRVSDRLWESLPVRLAWAVLVVLLVAVNVYLDGPGTVEASVFPQADRGHVRLLDAHRADLQALLEEAPGLVARPASGRSS